MSFQEGTADEYRSKTAPDVRIAAGAFHTAVICNGGWKVRAGAAREFPAVVMFGSNRHNVLTHSHFLATPHSHKGTEVLDDEALNVVQDPSEATLMREKNIASVACGSSHTAFLEKKGDLGRVWMAGLGNNGRLGRSRPESEESFQMDLEESGWADVPFKAYHQHESRHQYPQKTVAELVAKHSSSKFASGHEGVVKWNFPCPMLVMFPETTSIVAVECGSDHTLALSEAGNVYAWGLGNFGSLGTGVTADSWAPELVTMPGEELCVAIAAGSKHSMALSRQHNVFSWGHGGHGRLGQGSGRDASLQPSRVLVDAGVHMVSLSAGEAHSASICSQGNVHCWGAGSYGRTGHGEDLDQPVPKQVLTLSTVTCKQVALGSAHSLAVSLGGDSIYAWGTGHATGLFPNSESAIQATPMRITMQKSEDVLDEDLYSNPIIFIVAGNAHSLAMQKGGKLFGWGLCQGGRLGRMETAGADGIVARVPTLILEMGVDEDIEHDVQAEQIASVEQSELVEVGCGAMHSLALTQHGEIWSWGSNEFGQTGTGTEGTTVDDIAWIPRRLGLKSDKVSSICCGLDFCLAVADGRVWAWGRNHRGQLGLGHLSPPKHYQPAPVQLKGLSGAKCISAGEDHAAAVLDSGEVYTWGSTEHGKLGQGSSAVGGCQDFPRGIDLKDRLVRVSCGEQHTALVSTRKKLYTFGSGWYGRLGHGGTSGQLYPKCVETLVEGGIAVAKAECGAFATYVVSESHDVWCCGRDFAVCEVEHVEKMMLFKKVQEHGLPAKVQAMAAGSRHALVLTQGGALWAWGDNQQGQLGIYPSQGADRTKEPVQVLRQEGLKKKRVLGLTAGTAHSLARCATGEVYAWGSPASGRLGIHDPKTEEKAFSWNDLQPWVPRKVRTQWGQMEKVSKRKQAQASTEAAGKAIANAEADAGADEEEDIFSFAGLQKKLRAEQPQNRLEALRVEEQDLADQFQVLLDHIFHLWDPPKEQAQERHRLADAPQTTEWTIRRLQAQCEGSLCRNLKNMHLTDEFPDLQHVRTEADVAQRLPLYQELLWVLQQQPCYLGRLFRAIDFEGDVRLGRGLPPLPIEAVLRPVQAIFSELENDRVRHLYMALMSVVAKYEAVQPHRNISGSGLYRLLRIFVRHPFFHDLHRMLLDVDLPGGSLMSLVERWTWQDATISQDGLLIDFHRILLVESDFNFFKDEQEAEKLAREKEDDRERYIKQRFEEHMQRFLRFLGTPRMGEGYYASSASMMPTPEENPSDAAAKQPTQVDGKKPKGTIGDGMRTFVDFLARTKFTPDLKAMAVHTYRCLHEASLEKEATLTAKARIEGEWSKMLYVGQLIVYCLFSELVGNHTAGLSDMFISNLQNKIRSRLKPEQFEDSKKKKSAEKMVEKMTEKVLLNMRQLGRFFSPNNDTAKLPSALSNAKEIIFNMVLPPIMKRNLATAEDDLPSQLHTDLYLSHYDVTEHFVQLSTKDLLNLSNILWHYIKQDERNISLQEPDKLHIHADDNEAEGSMGSMPYQDYDLASITATPKIVRENYKKDYLYKLLDKIQPSDWDPDKQPRGATSVKDLVDVAKKPEELRCWQVGEIQDVEKLHNFRLDHRFLKTYRHVVFCSGCSAPCPRFLGVMDQVQEKEMCLIRPLRPRPGQEFSDPVLQGDPFRDLEELLYVLALKPRYQIKAQRFMQLAVDLANIEAQITTEGSSGDRPGSEDQDLDLVDKVSRRKRVAEALGMKKETEEDFRQFIKTSLDERAKQRRYLEVARRCLKPIKEEQKKYRMSLDRWAAQLRSILKASDECFLPALLLAKGAESAAGLVFPSLQRSRRKEQRKEGGQGHYPWRPCATYPVSWLRAKRVISTIGPEIPKEQFKVIMLKFASMNEGDWSVSMLHAQYGKTSMMFTQVLSSQELEVMKYAGKSAKVCLQDTAVSLNCFNLLQLLARIEAGAA